MLRKMPQAEAFNHGDDKGQFEALTGRKRKKQDIVARICLSGSSARPQVGPGPRSLSKNPTTTRQSVLKQLELPPRARGREREGSLSERKGGGGVKMRSREREDGRWVGGGL